MNWITRMGFFARWFDQAIGKGTAKTVNVDLIQSAQGAGNACTHEASNGATNERFESQFRQVFALGRSQLADAANLYTDGGYIGKPAKGIGGDVNGPRICD
jgi:hypothetical protein